MDILQIFFVVKKSTESDICKNRNKHNLKIDTHLMAYEKRVKERKVPFIRFHLIDACFQHASSFQIY